MTWFSSARRVAGAILKKISRDEMIDRSSGLAFQMLASLLPLMALAYYIFAQLNGFQALKDQAGHYALQALAPGLGAQIVAEISQVQQNVSPSTIGIFGVVGFFYAGILMIAKIETYLNIIWSVSVERPWGERAVLYGGLLIVGPILLGVSFGITTFILTGLSPGGSVAAVFNFVLVAVPYFFSSGFFYLLYRYLPYVKVTGKAARWGGCTTGLSFEILKQGFAFYAHYAITNSVYGSLAVLPLLVIWISFIAATILLGGELTCYFDRPSLFSSSSERPVSIVK